jgi:hypothetical protein
MAACRHDKAGSTRERSKYAEVAPDAVERVFTGCSALRAIRDGGTKDAKHHLTHEERLALASVLRDLSGGREALHQVLSGCPDYNPKKTDGHIDSLKHAPVRCETMIAWGLCAGRCEEIEKRKGKSPVRFAYCCREKKTGRRPAGSVHGDGPGKPSDHSPATPIVELSPRERFRERFGM